MNINLDAPRDTREDCITEQLDFWELSDLSAQFSQRRSKRIKGRWTWRQERLGRWVSSHPDYFMARKQVRKRFRRVVIRKPRHIIGTLWGGKRSKMQRYRRKVSKFPLQLPTGPHPHMETLFEELKATVAKKATRALPHNQWISERTWALVDHRAMLRSKGSLQQQSGRELGRRVSASFCQDRKDRAANAAKEIEAALNGGGITGGVGYCQEVVPCCH